MKKIKTALKLLKNDPKKVVSAMGRNNLLNWIPDKTYLKIIFYCETGNKLNLDSPLTFNEKLQWLKLYDRKAEYTIYSDKFAVREYIKKTIGEEYLIPIIGVYDTVDEIPWNELPNQFVLKCNHGSGCNIICKDKNNLDIDDAIKKLNKWIRKNYYYSTREWPYKNIRPRIVCEVYLGKLEEVPNDLKVMCFNGEAKLIELHVGRFSDGHTQDFYDTDWRKTPISQGGSFANNSAKLVPEPTCLKEMVMLSELLAKDIYHVRIDWYEINGRLYFGEITFFDASGFALFDNYGDDLMLGSWIRLPIDAN